MGLIIKKRFGPWNFVQYLHLKDVYSVGPKPRKKHQVYMKNPQEYIIPQSIVNSVLHGMQEGETVKNKEASKHFAKYYWGTGDSRSFVWTAKPRPPVATSLDRLGDDFDRNFGLNQTNLERAAYAKAHEKENRRLRDANIATKFVQRNKIRFKTWLRTARKHVEHAQNAEKHAAIIYNRKLNRNLPGVFQQLVF